MEIFNHSLWLLISYQNLGFFILGLYFYLTERSIARLIYSFFMLSFGANIFLFHIHLFEHTRGLTILFPLLLTTVFSIAPLYYLHMKSMLVYKYRFEVNEILHFVPLMVSAITLAPFWYLITANRPEYLDLIYGMFLLKKQPGHQTFLIETGIVALLIIQCIYYIIRFHQLFVAIHRDERKQGNTMVTNFLNTSKLFTFSFFMLMALIIARNYVVLDEKSLSGTLYILAVLSLNIGHAYFGIRFSDSDLKLQLYADKKTDDSHPQQLGEAEKQALDAISDTLRAELIENLETYFLEHKPYLNSKLRLEDIAQELQTNTRYLSIIINNHYGKNFTSFINDYRCKRVVELFHHDEYDDYSMDGIAESAGFHSRSTFVAAFKKFSGKLPSVYRNELRARK
ncbi:MAG: helix-turn-helix domain-containing protein [Bacteroidales bacterium]|nr:AraC family transcriptional regulator [Bacteroidales bacterium]MDD3700450.1 helix-turn-helix domain-containing protein [Bacteroidales bacterium]MDY0368664.1 helix-turn-helix domain-containing protein [Bacteroidales bacterium]